jgi:hypothetical protein
MGSSRSNRDNGALGVRPKRDAPDLRAWGDGGMPLEFRGASGALDKEHSHLNLPPDGCTLRLTTYPATCRRMSPWPN